MPPAELTADEVRVLREFVNGDWQRACGGSWEESLVRHMALERDYDGHHLRLTIAGALALAAYEREHAK